MPVAHRSPVQHRGNGGWQNRRRGMLGRLPLPRRELRLLAIAVGLGVALRVAYILISRHQPLAGDEVEYDVDAKLFAAGHLFWSKWPYGIAHSSAIKAPGYLLWTGVAYTLLGAHHVRLELLQALLCGPATIILTCVLARRLLTPRVAIVSAFLVAVYPLAWQFEARLYPESLATPLTLAVLIAFLEREPTARRAAGVGALIGVLVLVRPTSAFVLAGVAVTWLLRARLRRAAGLVALTVAASVLVVVPWTIRNAVVEHGFIPVSFQDAAAYGTFNATSAHDPDYPYAWRPTPPDVVHLFDPRHRLSEVALRADLDRIAVDYIKAHPFSVVESFYWNGLSRLWDVRHQSRALEEVNFEGRSRLLTEVGLDMYYVLLPLALLGLWRLRARRDLVFSLLAMALGASLVFTVASGTRYRATLEPVIVILACSALLGPLRVEPPGRGRAAA